MDKIQTAINSLQVNESGKQLNSKNESNHGKYSVSHSVSHSNNHSSNPMKPAVKHFWSTMANIYGGRFTDHMGATPNPEWIALFAKLNRQEVTRGYERMKTDNACTDWPPTVIRFEHLCKPTAEDMGLPSADDAYQMATGNHPHKHKAVAWTLQNMGAASWNVKHSVEKTSRPLFAEAYQKHAVEWLADGNTIPEIKNDNPSKFRPEKTQGDRDAHKEFMESFRSWAW